MNIEPFCVFLALEFDRPVSTDYGPAGPAQRVLWCHALSAVGPYRDRSGDADAIIESKRDRHQMVLLLPAQRRM